MESSCFVSSVSRPTLSSSAVWTGCRLWPSRPQGAVAVLGTDVDARKVSAKGTGGKGVLTHARAALTLATVRACLFWLFSLCFSSSSRRGKQQPCRWGAWIVIKGLLLDSEFTCSSAMLGRKRQAHLRGKCGISEKPHAQEFVIRLDG